MYFDAQLLSLRKYSKSLWLQHLFPKLTLKATRPKNPVYPTDLKTIGDYLRKTRLDRGLSQPQVAKLLNVTTNTITGWEINRNEPSIYRLPVIIKFIGFDPFRKSDDSISNKIENYRRKHGLAYEDLALKIGIDEGTLKKIARKQSNPHQSTLDKILNIVEKASD